MNQTFHDLINQFPFLVSVSENLLVIENLETNLLTTHSFKGGVPWVSFSEDETHALIFTDEKELSVVEVQNAENIKKLTMLDNIACAYFLGRTDNVVCLFENNGVVVYQPNLSKNIFETDHDSETGWPKISNCGTYIVCQKDNLSFQLWDVLTSKIIFQTSFKSLKIEDIYSSNDMKRVAIKLSNGELHIYDIERQKLLLKKRPTADILPFEK